MKTLRCMLLAVVVVGVNLCACADEATDQVRATTDKILALMADPALNYEAHISERR